jgi:benzoyl-CoA reductase/2-hydroxyglutaryl-CoA dehydratase subunit BcrC/BadD/HgdB
MRTELTRGEFFSRRRGPLVWRNLFFPPEVLNALGVRTLTLETYAALRGHSQKRLRQALDRAATKGFSSETCSFLRVLEGDERLPEPDFVVTTSEPCQQGERVMRDLAHTYGASDRIFALHTPSQCDAYAVEHVAGSLEEAVVRMERATGLKLDMGKLKEACALSNEAREINVRCNLLRYTSPPLMRGSEAILFATTFSQLWGRKDFVDLLSVFYEGLLERKEEVERTMGIDDTHRLLWLHLPPFYSMRLMDYIEVTCNAPIIFEEVNFVAWEPLDPDDPYRSLARKILTAGFMDPVARADYIRDYAYLGKLSGCILYNHGFGRCSMSDSTFIKYLRETLQQLTVPLLVLDGDCLDETTDPCSTLTKVAAFTEALNLTKYGNIFGRERERPDPCEGKQGCTELVGPAHICAAGDDTRYAGVTGGE